MVNAGVDTIAASGLSCHPPLLPSPPFPSSFFFRLLVAPAWKCRDTTASHRFCSPRPALQADTESEDIGDAFLSGDVEVRDFVKDFVASRKVYHARAAKKARMDAQVMR